MSEYFQVFGGILFITTADCVYYVAGVYNHRRAHWANHRLPHVAIFRCQSFTQGLLFALLEL